MTIKFIIWGDPKAKRRHRSRIARTKSGKQYNMQYADPKGVSEESFIKLVAAEHRPDTLITGPVFLKLIFYMPVPMSMPKKKRIAALFGYRVERFIFRLVNLWPTKKPDLSNTLKAVEDACNKVIWHDDSQICAMHIYKYYSENPRTEVYIEDLPSEY